MNPTVSSTVEQLEWALIRVMRRVNAPRSHEALMERAGVQLERSGYVLLVRVSEAGTLRLGALAEVAGVDASTASRQAKELCERGLLARVTDPDDGRAVRLTTTPAGEDALDRLRTARRASIEELLDGWAPEDVHSLGRLLDQFADSLEAASQ